MGHPVLTASVLVAGLVLSAFSLWRGRRPSLRVAPAVGIALRLFLLITAATDSWQPLDFAAGFRHRADPPGGKAKNTSAN
jgi:hypothetical protein